MDLTSVNATLNKLSTEIKYYLDHPPYIEGATYEQQQDIKYILNKYNDIVQMYGDLVTLQRDIEYFISLCKKGIRLLSGQTELEKAQKQKLKSALDLIKELAAPLYTEEKRLKTIEMFYRSVCTRRDF